MFSCVFVSYFLLFPSISNLIFAVFHILIFMSIFKNVIINKEYGVYGEWSHDHAVFILLVNDGAGVLENAWKVMTSYLNGPYGKSARGVVIMLLS